MSKVKEDSMECHNCKKQYMDSDTKDFEKFCSAECEATHKQEWADFKKEELEFEAMDEQQAEEKEERKYVSRFDDPQEEKD